MSSAPERRWFRFAFSLRTMFAVVIVGALVALAIREHYERRSIQGAWQGADGDERFSAIFAGETLIMRVGTSPILEPRKSRFQANTQSGFIDIARDDGLQLGLYSVDGETLTLKLADVGGPRPKDLDPSNNWSSGERRYVFKRE